MPFATRFRCTARVFVLDAHDRVTLVQYADDDGGRYWATPGGAIEPGETELDAAARELREELGLDCGALTPAGRGHARYVHAGVCIDQDEHYFVARVSRASNRDTAGQRAEGILAVRAFSLAEIEASSTPVYPCDLVERVRAFLGVSSR